MANITLTRHAKERLAERKINAAQVREALTRAYRAGRVAPGRQDGYRVCEPVTGPGKAPLVVEFAVEGNAAVIKTAYWQERRPAYRVAA